MPPRNDPSQLRRVWRWRLLAAAALPLAMGCAPAAPKLFDAAAVKSVKRVAVLPLADAPGKDGKGAGRVIPGAIESELIRLSRYDVIHVSPEQAAAALVRLRLAAEDCYDPVAAAELGRELKLDAVVCGELPHFGTQQEFGSTSVLIVAGGGTATTHWVTMNLRMVNCASGQIIYTGAGTASSAKGFGDAIPEAARQCLAYLKWQWEQSK